MSAKFGVSAQAPVSVGAHHLRGGELHGIQSISHELGYILIARDCVQSAASRYTDSFRHDVGRQILDLRCPLHAAVLEESVRGLLPLRQEE